MRKRNKKFKFLYMEKNEKFLLIIILGKGDPMAAPP